MYLAHDLGQLASGTTMPPEPLRSDLRPLDKVDAIEWRWLSERAVEPNAFLSPSHYLALHSHASRAKPAKAVTVRGRDGMLAGMLPLVGAWAALFLPIPALVIGQPYIPLGTPLIGGDDTVAIAGAMIDMAREAGVAMIALPLVRSDGPVAKAFGEALAARGMRATRRNLHQRAALSAKGDSENYLRGGLGAKKLKELRRQRHRLEDQGTVEWRVSRTPAELDDALERFLTLEASGWKGDTGTALGRNDGDAAYIRSACKAFGAEGRLEICELLLEEKPVASGIVFRSADHAFFFKTAYDEDHMRMSPGVQLTVELTRHLMADPQVRLTDSVAIADHPMIDHIWKDRIDICDLYLPTRKGIVPRICMAAFDTRGLLKRAAKAALSILSSSRQVHGRTAR
ncbi:GNAT family N-acetyltransferase [Pararhizobium haloflavum]|uniref:GNAT family N-acetyltransferase n=1 Tax=Pararhizobium haloflavum TaxID=2037914 RepID=UPI000C18441B|nr:GNAT family N-acetyltransferase [Pararhizobium haloflavum]